jgi:hypothetical protein
VEECQNLFDAFDHHNRMRTLIVKASLALMLSDVLVLFFGAILLIVGLRFPFSDCGRKKFVSKLVKAIGIVEARAKTAFIGRLSEALYPAEVELRTSPLHWPRHDDEQCPIVALCTFCHCCTCRCRYFSILRYCRLEVFAL